ncbi:RNA polymerase sigma factor [Promicromonospora sukumoe]|uniref:RNA polymerase sigma factor n=1 Tax=Promicromonospora sukumoe TaxID=88382 RepID=UPI001E2D7163|nr:RNA polymerase sigma factor [Promicromonospora sukumoe]
MTWPRRRRTPTVCKHRSRARSFPIANRRSPLTTIGTPEFALATNTEPHRIVPGTLTPERTEELFATHAHGVYRYARARLPAAEAEDVVAEVFAIAWRKGELPDHPRAWLLAVARRVLANQVRAQHRRTALADRVGTHPAPAGADDVRLVGELDELRRAMDLLRPADREVIALLAAAELSTAEVAQVLGCTTAVAANRVHRARGRLRAAYARLTRGRSLTWTTTS